MYLLKVEFGVLFIVFLAGGSVHADHQTSGNDLLCKVHNPLKRLFGHEKNQTITEADTNFSKMSTKN